ncbi:hypothetical protein [Brucella grignonensis]|uniref:hypothetical protein n=1 Tax=Brucella grignonensis TaxID=94627 RepID=UPI001F3CF402|nr:hypothetical protein [Brucella grignonensis]
MTHKTVSPALHALTILLLSSVTALAQTSTDEAYLERRNDQGIVAYCSDQGFLEPDSEEFFHVGTVEIFGEVEPSPEADLHEQKGRDGISYLQGDEQSLEDLAAANDVDVKAVCEQYKSQVTLGRMMAKNKANQ